MTRRSLFTTFDISALCQVNPTTVQNWVKEKKLRAYVTPGGHRRIRREDLVAFLKEFGMPLPPELQDSPPSILVVDDEESVREMLTEVFRNGEEEVEVLTASDGIEALLLIGERKPDLLVLDLRMPGMNGFEVCEKIKSSESTHNIRIVAISGDTETGIGDRILQSGAELFFPKPFDVALFRDACLQLIRDDR